MLGKRQFSLGYLMLEIFWVAVALGCFRAAFDSTTEPYAATTLFMLAGMVTAGAAIGGLFGRMAIGALVGFGIILVLGLLPAVMVA